MAAASTRWLKDRLPVGSVQISPTLKQNESLILENIIILNLEYLKLKMKPRNTLNPHVSIALWNST